MDSNQQNTSEPSPNTPDWVSIPIKRFDKIISPTVLSFDPYLVIRVDDFDAHDANKPVTFLAVDLRDNNVQKAELPNSGFFYDRKLSKIPPYTFTKYGENQIIRFGRTAPNAPLISLITIESFQPFTLKCEEIVAEKTPTLELHTAQIYNGFLYVFGGRTGSSIYSNSFWRFHIKNRVWELLKPAAGQPPGPTTGTDSFLSGDVLYVYGASEFYGVNAISTVDLKTLTWTKITKDQHKLIRQKDLLSEKLDQSILQNNILFIAKNATDKLNSWPIGSNTLTTIDIKPIPMDSVSIMKNPILIRNKIVVLKVNTQDGMVSMDTLNFSDIGLQGEVSEEEKRVKELFMNEEGSDLKLKVQDKLIPVHKEILIQRSKYFAGLFNSGMSESRENVIEIQDCDSDLFQGIWD